MSVILDQIDGDEMGVGLILGRVMNDLGDEANMPSTDKDWKNQ